MHSRGGAPPAIIMRLNEQSESTMRTIGAFKSDGGVRTRPGEPTVNVNDVSASNPAVVTQYNIELSKPATNGNPCPQ